MELSWHWPWVGLAGLIASLAVIAIMVLASAKRRHNDSGSVRTFSLDDDLNTETASRLFRQWRTMSRAAVVLLVMALVLAIALVARPSTVDEERSVRAAATSCCAWTYLVRRCHTTAK